MTLHIADNFGPLPDITGPVKGTSPDSGIEIDVQYPTRAKGYYTLWIKEESSTIVMYPPADAKVSYTNIAGVQVMDWEFQQRSISSSGTELHQALEFVWDQNSIHFEVIVSDYSRDEALKIVESMIQQ